MPIQTVNSLRMCRRRLKTRLKKAEVVLSALRAGSALHLQHTTTGRHWTLSNGGEVSDSVAQLVTASSSVVGVGDALFGECLAQTYRWWSETEEPAA
jgi:hypothetical protein